MENGDYADEYGFRTDEPGAFYGGYSEGGPFWRDHRRWSDSDDQAMLGELITALMVTNPGFPIAAGAAMAAIVYESQRRKGIDPDRMKLRGLISLSLAVSMVDFFLKMQSTNLDISTFIATHPGGWALIGMGVMSGIRKITKEEFFSPKVRDRVMAAVVAVALISLLAGPKIANAGFDFASPEVKVQVLKNLEEIGEPSEAAAARISKFFGNNSLNSKSLSVRFFRPLMILTRGFVLQQKKYWRPLVTTKKG